MGNGPHTTLRAALRRRLFRHVFYRRLGWRLLQRLLPTVKADW